MLAVVRKRNPYFPPGTWIECYDDGCRKVEVESVNNRLKVVKEVGLVIPQDKLEPFMSRALSKGFDK
jgi:hypothetical protein